MAQLNWAELVKDAAASGSSNTGSFEPLPAGVYDLKVLDVNVKQTSTGKTMFSVTTEVQSGSHAKRRLWDNIVISPDSPGAMGFFFRKMKALGLDENFFAQNPDENRIAQAMVGRLFKGKIKLGEYRGEPRNEFDTYAPASQGGPAVPGVPAAPGAPSPAPQAANPAPVTQAAPDAYAAPSQPAQAPQAAPNPWEGQAPAAAPAPAPGFNNPPAPPF